MLLFAICFQTISFPSFLVNGTVVLFLFYPQGRSLAFISFTSCNSFSLSFRKFQTVCLLLKLLRPSAVAVSQRKGKRSGVSERAAWTRSIWGQGRTVGRQQAPIAPISGTELK